MTTKRVARIRDAIAGLAFLSGLGLCLAPAAHADPFEGAEVVAQEELAEARGGFVSANGLTFGFGAVVRTYANDQLALQTIVAWTPQGVDAQHMGGPSFSITDMPGVSAAALNAATGAQVAHAIDGGQLRNLIVNSASDQSFRQEVDVTITLPGFETMQQGFDLARLGMRINSEVSLGLGGG